MKLARTTSLVVAPLFAAALACVPAAFISVRVENAEEQGIAVIVMPRLDLECGFGLAHFIFLLLLCRRPSSGGFSEQVELELSG